MRLRTVENRRGGNRLVRHTIPSKTVHARMGALVVALVAGWLLLVTPAALADDVPLATETPAATPAPATSPSPAPSVETAAPLSADAAASLSLSGSVPVAARSATRTYKLTHYRKVGYLHSFKLDLLSELPSPPRLLVVGGSRAERFEPSRIKKLTRRSAMNMSVSNCEPEDVWAFSRHMLKRAPNVKLRLFWAIQMRGLTDTTFAPGLVYDRRLSRWFPPELITEQKKRIGDVRIKDLLAAYRFSARGVMTYGPYDRRRARVPLSTTLDRWIASHVRKESSSKTLRTDRAKSYFEATMKLYNDIGVTPCIVIMPYHPRALRALRGVPAWRDHSKAFKAYLRGLQETYKFHLLNYSLIGSFGGKSAWFYDGAHITVENARLLLRQAKRDAPECFR